MKRDPNDQHAYELIKRSYGYLSNEDIDAMIATKKTPAPFQRMAGDGLGDIISELTGKDTGTETLVRQEFLADTQIENILRNHNIDPTLRPIQNMEVDYTMDLQQALAAIDQAKRANFQVPDELRGKYPDWRAVLNGAESGQYQVDLSNLAERKEQVAKEKAERDLAEKEFQEWNKNRTPKEAPKEP